MLTRVKMAMAACVALTASVAYAWDGEYAEPSLADESLYVGQIVPADDGGWWLRTGIHVARTDAAMNVQQVTTIMPLGAFAPYPDGGFVARTNFCGVQRLSADGRLLWLRQPFERSGGCEPPQVDANGGTWLPSNAQVFRFDANGNPSLELDTTTLGFTGIDAFALDPLTGGAFVAGMVPDRARIVLVRADGSIAWTWTSPMVGDYVTHVARRADGRMLAIGRAVAPVRLLAVILENDGRLQARQAQGDVDEIAGVAPAADGGAFVYDHDTRYEDPNPGRVHVTRLGSDGRPRWRTRLTGFDYQQDEFGEPPRLLVTGNDELWVTSRTLVGSGNQRTPWSGVAHVGPNGTLLAALPQLSYSIAGARLGIDGSPVFVLADHQALQSLATITPTHAVQRVPVSPRIPDEPILVAATVSALGDTYTLTRSAAPSRWALALRDLAGAQVWRVEGESTQYAEATITANGYLVCLHHNLASALHRLECRDRNTGALTFSVPVPVAGVVSLALDGLDNVVVTAIEAADAGGFVQRRRVVSPIGMPISAFDAGPWFNPDLLDYVPPPAPDTRIDGSTLLTGTAGDGAPVLHLVERNGSMRFTRPLDPAVTQVLRQLPRADTGRFAVLAQHEDESVWLHAFAADGTPLWSRDGFAAPRGAAMAADNARVYVLTGPGYAFFAQRGSSDIVVALDWNSGATLWERALPGMGSTEQALLPDDLIGSVVAVNTSPHAVRIASIDRPDGVVRRLRVEPCGNCGFVIASLARNGDLVHVNRNFDFRPPAVTTRYHRLATVREDPLPQALSPVDGIWYTPHLPGQGLLLDRDRTGTTVFMAWFTYAAVEEGLLPDDERARQRWYTLQGTTTPNALGAVLDVYRHSGGAFLDATPVTTERIGSATLSFHGCRHARLRFAIDAPWNGFEAGEFALARATATPGCDDTAVSANPERVAVKQGDALPGIAQNGAWSDGSPAQGLLLDFGTPGQFLGAWFTYEPAGTADDTGRVHWFTLQGAMSNAAGDAVTVPIYESTGGYFDTYVHAPVYTARIGEATFTLTACDRLAMTWRFDDSEEAGAFRARTGQRELRKLDGC